MFQAMKPQIDYTLYLVTDRALMNAPTLEQAVEQAINGGCTLVQLREKEASSREFYRIAVNIKRITDYYRVPLLINDRVDLALAVDAAGVHVGQSDLPAALVRRIIGPHKIIGVSAATLAEAVQAEQDGADYLGVGAMFATDTKSDVPLVTFAELKRIKESVGLPLVAIGGINEKTIPQFAGSGIAGVAAVSAVLAGSDIQAAAQRLKSLFLEIKQDGNLI
jgi:thiamine-phosphate pyrophosphorylase